MTPLRIPSIIDVESSGFGPDSYPIEIGVAHASGARYCSLIKPRPDWTHWRADAEAVHGIDRALLARCGKAVGDVARDLNTLLDGQTVYSDGWVVDQRWVARLYHAAAIRQRFFLSPLEIILTEAQMTLWHRTKEAVIRERNLARHRASTDAGIIQETYKRTRDQLRRSA